MESSELIIRRITQAFSPLSFDEGRHLYFWNGVRVPKSVTKLTSEQSEPFDEDYWAPRCVIKEKVQTAHEVKHIWQTKRQDGCELGTETHDYMEYYNGVKYPDTPQKKAGVKYLMSILPEYEILFRELRMYSIKYNFAGTLDLLLRHRITGNIIIVDYKTNKDLFKDFRMLLPPFQYLPNSPYSKYLLQLSYYDIMLEDIGIPISDRIIVHLMADGEFKTYLCFNFKKQLRNMLN